MSIFWRAIPTSQSSPAGFTTPTRPPYKLPDEKTKSTIKSYSSKGGDGFNELRFEDKKGQEQVFIHGQKDLDVRIQRTRKESSGRIGT